MFYERYLQLCSENKLSPSAAAEKAGFNRGTVSVWKKKYEAGVDVRPEPDVIGKICAFFKCSETWLLGIEETEKAAGQKADGRLNEFIELFTELSPEQQDFWLSAMRGMRQDR